MKVAVRNLDGVLHTWEDVDDLAFANRETFGLPAVLERQEGKSLVIVNVDGYASLKVSD